MSNLLEWIEEEIKELKKGIKETEDTLKEESDIENINACKGNLKEYKYALSHLLQIRIILKGWNGLKDKITFQRGEFIPHLLAIKKGHTALTYLEYKDIEKALEEMKDEN